MDHFQKNLLLGLMQDEITAIRRGEKVYGDATDQLDAYSALREMVDELTRTGRLGHEDPDAPLVINLGGDNYGAINL